MYLFGRRDAAAVTCCSGQCAAAERRGLRCAFLPLTERAALAPQMLEGPRHWIWSRSTMYRLSPVTGMEEALFALFNRCRDRATRMVFSADCGPAALPLRLPDLRSRLAWGLSLSLQPLDDAGRMQLLQSLAARRALKLPEDVARHLLERTAPPGTWSIPWHA